MTKMFVLSPSCFSKLSLAVAAVSFLSAAEKKNWQDRSLSQKINQKPTLLPT